MICPNCRKACPDNAAFCPFCAHPIPVPVTDPGAHRRPGARGLFFRPLSILLAVLVVALGIAAACLISQPPQPRNYDDCMALAARYLEEEDFERAEAMYLEAIQLDPSQVAAYRDLAGMYVQLGRFGDALDLLIQGHDATGSAELLTMLDELLEHLSYQQCLTLAEYHLEREDNSRAETAYLAAIALDGSQVDAYRALAGLYISLGRTGDAFDLLLQGHAATGSAALLAMLDELLSDLSYQQCLTLAEYHLEREDSGRAETAYRAAIALDGSQVDAYRALAGLYISLGQTGDALDLLLQGHAATDSTALLAMLDELLSDLSYQQCLTLAAYHLEREDSSRAETVYLAAIALDGSQVDAYRALAELYISLGRTEDAIDLLERGIAQTGSSVLEEMLRRLLPAVTDLRSFLGLSYFDYEEAGLAYADSVEGISLDYGDISYDIRSDSSGALLTFLCDDGDTPHLPVCTVSASLDDSGTSYSACGAVLGMAQGAVPDAIRSSGGTVEQTYNSGLRASDADDTIIFVHFSGGVVDYLVVSTLVDDRTGYFFRDLAPMYARVSSVDLYPLRDSETPYDFADAVDGTWHNLDGTDNWSGFSAPYGTITTEEGTIHFEFMSPITHMTIFSDDCTSYFSVAGATFDMDGVDTYILFPTHGLTLSFVQTDYWSTDYEVAWRGDSHFIPRYDEDEKIYELRYDIRVDVY